MEELVTVLLFNYAGVWGEGALSGNRELDS